jgi:hypothetical protein
MDGTASLIFIPSFEDAGTYPVTVTVTDDGCPFDIASDSFNITVNNINRAPNFYGIGDHSVKEGDPRRFALLATDDDGDTITFSETGLPDFASLTDNGDGTGFVDLEVTSDSSAGEYDVTITASDSGSPSESVSEIIRITALALGIPPESWPPTCGPDAVNRYFPTYGDTAFEPPYFIYGNEVSYIAQMGEKIIIDVAAGSSGWYQSTCYQCVVYDDQGNIIHEGIMRCRYNEHNVVSDLQFVGLPENAFVYDLGQMGNYSSRKRIEWIPQEGDVGVTTITAIARTRQRTEDFLYGGTTWSNFNFTSSQKIKVAVNALKAHSIEFTQAIQEEQNPTEMQTYLSDHNNNLPVPLVAGKPAVMRVNFNEIPVDTDVNVVMILASPEDVELWEEQTVHISNQCTPDDRRRQSLSGKVPCNTANFYTEKGEPPEGTYTVWVLLEYPDSHNLPNLHSSVDQEAKWTELIPTRCEDVNDFSCQALSYPPILNRFDANRFILNIKRSDELVLGAVSVCAEKVAGKWQCFPNPISGLNDRIKMLKKIAPTHSVKVEHTGKTIKLEAVGNLNGDLNSDGFPDLYDCYDQHNNIVFNGFYNASGEFRYSDYDRTKTPVKCEEYMWWMNVALRMNRLYTMYEQFMEPYLDKQKYYFGLFDNDPLNPNLGPWAGWAHDIPSRGAVGAATSNIDFDNEIVAHETGHMLGARHTNKKQPISNCELSKDTCSLWPYDDNHIKSGPGPFGEVEVGFDVESYSVIPQPDITFDIMSYCYPRWISPHIYKKFGETLIQSGIPLAKAEQSEVLTTSGTFWLVSGFIGDGEVALSPVFAFETVGPVEPGAGIFRIEIHDAIGNVLFTRFFTPFVPRLESPAIGIEVKGLPTFSELVQYQSTGTNLLIIDNFGTVIAQESLGGVAPTVSIEFPSGGETLSGDQFLLWSVSDPDSSTHVYWIDYSSDGGNSWNTLAQEIAETNIQVNFNELPGSTNESLIRVTATDGANTGFSVSNSFSVPKKIPISEIQSPTEGSQKPLGIPIYFEGLGFDVDDGVLDETSLVWESSVDGVIGNGAEFSISNLSEGVHTITLKVTDSDGNQTSDAITFSVVPINPGEIAPCDGNSDPDTDVDGIDLAAYISNTSIMELSDFALEFGRTNCP